MGVVLR
ncbi:hypothetical protein PMLGA01_120043000 [Plasmodium malariae]|nr:hypothetical protein PMLGA01_120043000 [Plasmodium malariae]